MSDPKTADFRIYVVSRPAFDMNAVAMFLADRGLTWKVDETASDAERLVEVAGRVCYLSFSEDVSKIRFPNSDYISNLISKGHESVLEHACWTFILDGVSRAFSHQLVRHRVGFSFSQLSQQYHDESDASFVVPDGVRQDSHQFRIWSDALSEVHKAYRSLLAMPNEAGPDNRRERLRWIRSVARSLLPNATSTTIAVTANARAIRDFLAQRGIIEGDYEMRKVSVALLREVMSDAPALFSDFSIVDHGDGAEIIVRKAAAAT